MSSLDAQLHAFASHVREPGAHPVPEGIDDRRMAIYRRLVRGNLRSLLATNFPVIRKTLPGAGWESLIEGFLSGFASQSPLFTRIGGEFTEYLRQRSTEGDDPPWLPELAHYEWAELALQIDDCALPAHDPDGDLAAGIPVPSPRAWAFAYRWPVHRIGPEYQPDTPGASPTLLLLRRDAAGDVHFSELSPLVYRLLQMLDEDDTRTGTTLLGQLAGEAHATDREGFMREGLAMLERLRGEGTILGTRPAPA